MTRVILLGISGGMSAAEMLSAGSLETLTHMIAHAHDASLEKYSFIRVRMSRIFAVLLITSKATKAAPLMSVGW